MISKKIQINMWFLSKISILSVLSRIKEWLKCKNPELPWHPIPRYDTRRYLARLPELQLALSQLRTGHFNPAEPHKFAEFTENLISNDRYWGGQFLSGVKQYDQGD